MLVDWRFARRVIGKRLGWTVPIENEDRRVLETIIFPYCLGRGARSVLFVGCDWYTRHYQRHFFEGIDFWTIEVDPRKRKYGARQHLVAPLEELERHVPEERFDLILCNGVYGWGLDGREQCEAAFRQCRSRLRPGGLLVIGWDDVPEHDPLDLDELTSLRAFDRHAVPVLDHQWRYVTDTPYRHTYDFYEKR
ncbi:MAG: class I SAM-dependent methyltransferase [Candidatus Eisenbacteria bacterium]|uniref:Class I SAM-dependent methyltransferase n=1 Tax=Eiseniibacteriota bacterium TaxID=2212470 RepID=A0A956LX26_UNCEI|nr:class I SAM-dependent methyltransferase [Candidatus Eisenbacteria bacterium]